MIRGAKLEKRARRQMAEDAEKRRNRAKSSKTPSLQDLGETEVPGNPGQHGGQRQYPPQ